MLRFEIEGHKMVSFGDGITDERCSRAVLTGKEYKGVKNSPPPEKDDSWLDLGANIGASALWFNDKGAKRIVSVEPDKDNVESCRRNTKHIKSIKVIQGAVVNRTFKGDKVHLHLSPTKTTSHQVRDMPIRGRTQSIVDAIKFNDLLKDSRCDCVKMDIEGMERLVILDTKKTHWKDIRKLYVEYHFGINPMIEDFEKVVDLLKSAFPQVHLSSPIPEKTINLGKWNVYPNMRMIYCWR